MLSSTISVVQLEVTYVFLIPQKVYRVNYGEN